MIENKIVPITEEISLSSVFIHELLDMTFGFERALSIIKESCVEAYDKWEKYKDNLKIVRIIHTDFTNAI